MRGIPGSSHPQWLDVLHRQHAVVEDHVRAAKATGLGLLPSASWRINTAWVLLTGIARDLDVWTRLLAFADHPLLARAEPATMRELVYSLPARRGRPDPLDSSVLRTLTGPFVARSGTTDQACHPQNPRIDTPDRHMTGARVPPPCRTEWVLSSISDLLRPWRVGTQKGPEPQESAVPGL